MTSFPNIELIKDEQDRAVRMENAQRAVGHLRGLVQGYAELVTEREKAIAEREARRSQDEAQRTFSDEVDSCAGGSSPCRKNRTRSAEGEISRRS